MGRWWNRVSAEADESFSGARQQRCGFWVHIHLSHVPVVLNRGRRKGRPPWPRRSKPTPKIPTEARRSICYVEVRDGVGRETRGEKSCSSLLMPALATHHGWAEGRKQGVGAIPFASLCTHSLNAPAHNDRGTSPSPHARAGPQRAHHRCCCCSRPPPPAVSVCVILYMCSVNLLSTHSAARGGIQCVHKQPHTHTYTHTATHTHLHTYTHAHIHTYTHSY